MKSSNGSEMLYRFKTIGLTGGEIALEHFAGQVMLIVNTASQCGYTSQYRQLESLYRQYAARGFVVIGFPCNQFGAQEPGNAESIAAFCELNYGVTFPLSAKIEVNGEHAHPLYTHLKQAAPGVLGTSAIKWNFTKFLVDRNGNVVSRYAPATSPMKLARRIESLLQ